MNIDKAIDCCIEILIHLNREAMDGETSVGVKLEREKNEKWFLVFSDYNDDEIFAADDPSLPGVVEKAIGELRDRLKDDTRAATDLMEQAAFLLDGARL